MDNPDPYPQLDYRENLARLYEAHYQVAIGEAIALAARDLCRDDWCDSCDAFARSYATGSMTRCEKCTLRWLISVGDLERRGEVAAASRRRQRGE